MRAPELRRHPQGRAWHERTRAWWRDLWTSSIASQYSRTDEHGLFIIAVLRDAFSKDPQPALAGEIRLQEARFGLDPIARLRLGWLPARKSEPPKKSAELSRPSDPLAFLRRLGSEEPA